MTELPTTEAALCKNCGQLYRFAVRPGAPPRYCADACRAEFVAAYMRARRAATRARPASDEHDEHDEPAPPAQPPADTVRVREPSALSPGPVPAPLPASPRARPL